MADLYVPQNAAEIRDDFLTTIRLESIRLGTEQPVTPGSDNYVLATAVANVAIIQYANVASISAAITPLDATDEELDRWRDAAGLSTVGATPSSGAIVVEVAGTSTIIDGTEFTLPNGLRGKVVGTWPAVADGDEIDVITIDTGEDTELDAGEIVRFVSPPANVSTEAEVSKARPLRGGRDAENDPAKRERVLNKLGGDVAGGNWRHLRDVALSAAGIQNCYVYPAIGGPSSVKVVPVREYDVGRRDFSRVVDTATLTVIRGALFEAFPGEDDLVVQAAADESVDVTLQATLPDSILAGGSGTGWKDAAPWPPLTGAETKVTVGTVNSSRQVILDGTTTTPPVAGVTHVVWWNPTDMRFEERLITAQAGGTGAWQITLDRPLVADDGTIVATGDYFSPAAENSVKYGEKWVELVGVMGAGENTSDTELLPRALRHPFVTDDEDISFNVSQLTALKIDFDELTDLAYAERSLTSPTTPGLSATAPNVLVVRKFGIYPT